MAIYLDDQEVELACQDLGSLLDVARTELESTGRIVVEVHLNGTCLDAAEIERRRHEDIGAVECRLYSAQPRELAESTLRQVQARLEESLQIQSEAAGLFQQDSPDKAMARVGDMLAIWQQTGQAVLSAAMLVGLRLDDHQFEDRPVKDLTDALLAQIKTLRELIEAGDTIGMADALAYEWPQTNDQWSRLIDELIGWIRGNDEG